MRITFVDPDGNEHAVEGKAGQSVMHCAIENHIAGIAGECGGVMACATCHGYIASPWAERLPPVSDIEQDMLDGAIDPRPESRLTCQIVLDDTLDSMVVTVPTAQS